MQMDVHRNSDNLGPIEYESITTRCFSDLERWPFRDEKVPPSSPRAWCLGEAFINFLAETTAVY